MSDPLERLRQYPGAPQPEEVQWAVAEIERLRTENDKLIGQLTEAVEEREAEIERLQAVLTDISLMKMPWQKMPDIARRALEEKE